jgi:peptide/nickel transport system permease protein
MLSYVVRRLAMLPVLLFGVTLLIFFMLQFLSPIERASLYIRDIPRNERAVEGVIIRYDLDAPLTVQYWNWLVGKRDPDTGEVRGGVLRGDFGYSRTNNQFVVDIIRTKFPATLELTMWAAFPIIAGGVWLGVQSAVHHNKFIDQIARVFSILGYSLPIFVFGLVVLMIFYAQLRWFPPGRLSDAMNQVVLNPEVFHRYTTMNTIDAILNLRFDVFLDSLRHIILPVITLSYFSWAVLVRVTRSSMLESLRQDYITTARAKGLKPKDVISRHARPNALIPVATVAGLQVLVLLSGVIITETVFDYPGMGQAMAQASVQLDVIAVLGLTLFNAAILVMVNLVVDVMYAFIDPRIRLE